jgi:superfamily II DNA or RNA helicase
MTYQLPEWLWEPQRRSLQAVMYEFTEGAANRILLQSPTGTGKTAMAQCLFQWADSMGVGGNFYVNRKLLIGQSFNRFKSAGLDVAVRAAEYDEMFDKDCAFQVSSAQSEDARVYKSSAWDLHHVGDGGIVVVDESHIQKSQVMKNILGWYEKQNARIVLLTATPVNMGSWADKIIVSGQLREWRDCGALVPVFTHTISQPDLTKVKKNKDGEFVLTAEKKKRFVQSIVGEVIENFEKLHEGGPCFCYCPGVAESAWMADQFVQRGHRFIHVDATNAIVDGVEKKLDRDLWDDIVAQLRDGRAKGVTSRFKLREGVDIPSATHAILATPIGSLSSYLQICGRIMRSCEGKSRAILQDHGGVFHSQGSPNQDRDWETLWKLSENAASSFNMDNMREKVTPEPIRCWNCGMERLTGPTCPKCGTEAKQSRRLIRQESGELREVTGDIVVKVRRVKRADTEKLWTQMYYGYANKKIDQSFHQLEAFFYREHGYRPTRDLPFMPRHTTDWYQKVHTVPMERLTGRNKEKVSE